MKHIEGYKTFESYSDDVFPDDHTLAGMNVIKVLEEIYATIPQEEIVYRKDDYIDSQGEDSYKTMVDVGGKRVTLIVSIPHLFEGGPFKIRVRINRYDVGMKKINWALYRRMKKLYKDLFK